MPGGFPPGHLEHWLQICLNQGECARAVSTLESLIQSQPENARLYFRHGLLLAAIDPPAAVAYLETAQELDAELAARTRPLRSGILVASREGDPSFTLVSAGRVLAALDEWQLAVAAFERAVQANPSYPEAWAYLGEARQHLPDEEHGSSQVGLGEIHKALQLDPASLSGHLFLSLYWSRQGRCDLSAQAARSGLRYHARQAVLSAELGRVLALCGDLAGAAEAYIQAAELEPRQAAYLRQVVDFSLEYSYLVEALALPAARAALELAPDDARNLDCMAQVEIRLGHLDEAGVLLQKALRNDPQLASSHLHYGYLLALQGDFDGALEEFQLVHSLAPDSLLSEQAQRLIEGMLQ